MSFLSGVHGINNKHFFLTNYFARFFLLNLFVDFLKSVNPITSKISHAGADKMVRKILDIG